MKMFIIFYQQALIRSDQKKYVITACMLYIISYENYI
jgi:hypothetical protein